MRQFNKITIIGVGLIGGSIGLAVKKRRSAKEVIGVFRHIATLKKAVRCGAVDRGTMDLREGVKDADLIIIATPVHLIPELVKEAALHAKFGAVLTDVGSTKSWIVKEIEKTLSLYPSVFFIGSHPMAGSEQTGVESAKDDLLEGSPCIVTRTDKTDKRALSKVAHFWSSLGTRVEIMDPARHDRSVSLISHLPHLVAFGLAGAVPQDELRYAAEGFKDTTRVASSDPLIWADIFLTNRKEVISSARIFERYYKRIIRFISSNKYSELVRCLKRAKAKRDLINLI